MEEKSFSLVIGLPRGLEEMRINKNKLVEQNVQGEFSSMCKPNFQVFKELLFIGDWSYIKYLKELCHELYQHSNSRNCQKIEWNVKVEKLKKV